MAHYLNGADIGLGMHDEIAQTKSEMNLPSLSLTCQAFRKEGPVQFWGKWTISDNTQKEWIMKSWWKYSNAVVSGSLSGEKGYWDCCLENSGPRFPLTKATFEQGLQAWPACSVLRGWHTAELQASPASAAELTESPIMCERAQLWAWRVVGVQ